MSCWAVLGIDPTTDKKLIKKAYAVLLKNNKPDEHPQEFKRLHSAYKQCLKSVAAAAAMDHDDKPPRVQPHHSRTTLEDIDSQRNDHPPDDRLILPPKDDLAPVPTKHIDKTQAEIIHAYPSDTDQPIDPDGSSISDAASRPYVINEQLEEAADAPQACEDLNSAWEQLEQQTQDAIAQLKSGHGLEPWCFLETNEALLDLELKIRYSDLLFESMLVFFEKNEINPAQRRMVIKYINGQLNWLDHSSRLVQLHSHDRVLPIVEVLEDENAEPKKTIQWTTSKIHLKPMVFADFADRLLAALIDLLIIFFFVAVTVGKNIVQTCLVSFLSYLLVTPIMEATPLQGGPGKILRGLKVTSFRGRRLNIFHACWRQFICLLFVALFKITVWFAIAAIRAEKEPLVRDYISRAIVIRRN